MNSPPTPPNLKPGYVQYLAHEATATRIEMFHPLFFPGLLQTADVATALLGALHAPDVTTQVELRMQRQHTLLFGEPRRDITVLFDEAVLTRRIGTAKVWHAQLQALEELARNPLPGLTIGMIPFSAGLYPAMAGPFIVLQNKDHWMLYAENAYEDLFLCDGEPQISVQARQFRLLRRKALYGLDLAPVLAHEAARWAKG